MAKFVTIKPDEENNAEEFWGHLDDQFPSIAMNLRDSGRCNVTRVQWEQIQSLPGFAAGAKYAPNALIVIDE